MQRPIRKSIPVGWKPIAGGFAHYTVDSTTAKTLGSAPASGVAITALAAYPVLNAIITVIGTKKVNLAVTTTPTVALGRTYSPESDWQLENGRKMLEALAFICAEVGQTAAIFVEYCEPVEAVS